MVEVVLENLCKSFGKVKAVDNLSLKVKDKEFLTLLGPSGCGKTTTLRIIAGLETLDSGNIYIGDRVANYLPPKERNVAMVFQSYALYPHMTVFENMVFPLKARKVPKAETKKMVAETAELLGIENLLDRYPKQLSGGQQQRAALGRAIVRSPDLFLLDEPLSNLDAKLRVYMRVELKKLQKRLGITTVYVTHDQVEAMTMSDRIAILNEGRLQQIDTPEAIYARPANVGVAGFVGAPPMNFFDCNIVNRDNGSYLESQYFSLKVPNEMQNLVNSKSVSLELALGVRPDDMEIYRIHSHEAPQGSIKAEVYMLELLGGESVVDLKIGEDIFKVRTGSEFRAEIGEEVYVRFEMSKIHVFDKKTGKAII